MFKGKNNYLSIVALDDDSFIREVIRKTLGEYNNLYLAETINEFRGIIETVQPQIFLIDINLPDGNGIDLCVEMKSRLEFRDSFIIILTGQINDETIEMAYSNGADDYLRKPFNPYELNSKIKILKKTIDARNSLRQSFQAQLDHNVQLFRLGNYIKKLFDQKDLDSILRSSDVLMDLVDIDYIEIIKVKKGLPLSISHKNRVDHDKVISFKEFRKNLQNVDTKGKNYSFLRSQKKNRKIFICFIIFKIYNSVYGYTLLEKDVPFSQSERELMFLYLDYVQLLSGNMHIQNELKTINENYKKEIEIIRKFELSLFPDFSQVNEFDLAYSFMPALELSGDFFDGYYIDDDIYQIILCDVAGHGIASSYIGNQIRTLFRSHSGSGKSPSEVAAIVNNSLSQDLAEFHHYCTAQIIQIFTDTGQVIFMSAGHPPALIWKDSEKKFIEMGSENPVIGMFDDITYKDTVINMSRGDYIFMYTDGITEESSLTSEEMFGLTRLKSSLIGKEQLESLEIVHSCLGDFYEFNGYRPQHDDITLLCIKRH